MTGASDLVSREKWNGQVRHSWAVLEQTVSRNAEEASPMPAGLREK
jgi:hypothetical protein